MTPEQVQKRWNGYDDAQRNAWVAVSVMGWKVRGVQTRMGYLREYRKPDQQRESDWIQGIPEFSTDHNHAHEALATFDYAIWKRWVRWDKDGQASCLLQRYADCEHGPGYHPRQSSAPAAISLACVMAVECKENTDA